MSHGLSLGQAWASLKPCKKLRLGYSQAWAAQSQAIAMAFRPSWACTSLFKVINNHTEHVQAVKELLEHVETRSLKLCTSISKNLKTFRVFENFKGFQNNPFHLYKLANLLCKNWLEEDVLNGLCELRYLHQHTSMHQLDSMSPPDFLYLPTNFFTTAQSLFYSTPRKYNTEFLDLRKWVSDTVVNSIAFTTCTDNHYAAYWRNQSYFEHGDSLRCPPFHEALEIIQWVFAGLGHNIPSKIVLSAITLQGSGNGGD